MGNSQPLGDRGPAGTTSWAPGAPQQPRLPFLSSSLAVGPRLWRGLALLPVICRSAIPTPTDGDGKRRPTHDCCFLTKPSRPQLQPWLPPCRGMVVVAGRRVGWDHGSPHGHVLTARWLRSCCAWGRWVGEPASASGQELRPKEPPWGVGAAALSTLCRGIYEDLCLLGRCWGSGCAHAALGRTPANLLPMGARLSQDGPTSVPYWLLRPRDRAEKHHN